MANYDAYIGQQSNYGKIKSIWPQSAGYVLLNTEDGSQFMILGYTIQIRNKEGLKLMIMRSDLTGVTVGFYDKSPSSIGDLNYYRVVCNFLGDKEYAEKQATDFVTAYNEHFSFIENAPTY